MAQLGRKNPMWKGVGDISSTWFSNVLRRANRDRPSMMNVPVRIDIDINYTWELFLKQGRKCVYSGIELHFPIDSKKSSYKESTASLDRIDSSKGYVKGNVQFVHKHVNMMKSTYSEEYFIELCTFIAKHNEC